MVKSHGLVFGFIRPAKTHNESIGSGDKNTCAASQGAYYCTNILSFISSENQKRIEKSEKNDESYGNDKKAISELYNAFINLDKESHSHGIGKEYGSTEYSETYDKINTIAKALRQMKSKTICAEDVLRLVKQYMISERNFMRL